MTFPPTLEQNSYPPPPPQPFTLWCVKFLRLTLDTILTSSSHHLCSSRFLTCCRTSSALSSQASSWHVQHAAVQLRVCEQWDRPEVASWYHCIVQALASFLGGSVRQKALLPHLWDVAVCRAVAATVSASSPGPGGQRLRTLPACLAILSSFGGSALRELQPDTGCWECGMQSDVWPLVFCQLLGALSRSLAQT